MVAPSAAAAVAVRPTVAGAVKLEPAAGLVMATAGAAWLQLSPFSVKLVGAGLLPAGLSPPLNPMFVIVWLVPTWAFQPASFSVTFGPDWDQVPPQPPWGMV